MLCVRHMDSITRSTKQTKIKSGLKTFKRKKGKMKVLMAIELE